ncbi:MAG: WbqC family protein [Desulfobacterales bacterium]|nr:WbqC family protein [Desulfobacterales bacterium]
MIRVPARDAGHRRQTGTSARRRSTASEDPTERLIDICRALGADTYLAGAGRGGLHGPGPVRGSAGCG